MGVSRLSSMKLMKDESLERQRLLDMCRLEQPYWDKGLLVAGIDEAGRGPLAGPCVAAAVVMPPGCLIEGVNDSKKLSEKKREALYEQITAQAVCYGVGIVDNHLIDQINILKAAQRAFVQALDALSTTPVFVFSDRIGGIETGLPYQEIVGGDRLCYSVAAASIIAKVTRDRMMRAYDEEYVGYGFAKHKGYGTREHIEAILANGTCGIHRTSFLKRLSG